MEGFINISPKYSVSFHFSVDNFYLSRNFFNFICVVEFIVMKLFTIFPYFPYVERKSVVGSALLSLVLTFHMFSVFWSFWLKICQLY